MRKSLKLVPVMACSLALGVALNVSETNVNETKADTSAVTLGLGNAMLNYINNSGKEVTSNEFFNYTIAVGSLSSGVGDTLGSFPAAYVTRANNKELGGAAVGDLDYHTDWALGRMHSQNDKRFQWVITAKHNVSLNINVAKLLSYPTDSELKYYVFDGDIPNGSYVNDARLKATYKFNGVVNDGSIYNYSGELKSGQKFVLEWGYQHSGKRNINISSSGSQMFTATVTPTAQDNAITYASLLGKVSKNSGNAVKDLTFLPLSSAEVLHGDVGTSSLSKFETVSEGSLTTSSGAQALNWRLVPAPKDNIVVKLVANEKVLLKVTRPILGTEWLTNTYVRYWHNTELEKTINFEAAPADSSVFNFDHILQKGDTFYFEFGTTAADATRNMSCLTGGDVNTSLPVFTLSGFDFRAENLHETHTLSKHDGLTETCTTDGYVEYYECDVCDATFEDDQAATSIADLATWKTGDGKIAKHHTLQHHEAVPSTCEEDGTIEYWECTVCKKTFSDSAAANEVTSVVDPQHDHSMTHESYVKAGLDTDGQVEHWFCSECEKAYADEEGTEVIENPVTPAKRPIYEGLKEYRNETYKREDYGDIENGLLDAYLDSAIEGIVAAESDAEVQEAVNAAKELMKTVKSLAEQKAELDAYKEAAVEALTVFKTAEGYRPTDLAKIVAIVDKAIANINEADSMLVVDSIVTKAKSEIKAITPDEFLSMFELTEKKAECVALLDQYLASRAADTTTYWDELVAAIVAIKSEIALATTIAEVETAFAKLDDVDVPNDQEAFVNYVTETMSELYSYVSYLLNSGNYTSEDQQSLISIYNQGRSMLLEATSYAYVDAVYDAVMTAVEKVPTAGERKAEAFVTAKENAVAELKAYDGGADAYKVNSSAYLDAIDAGEKAIRKAKDSTQLASALADAKAAVDAINNDTEAAAAAANVDTLVNAVGTVEFTEECKAKIDAAVKAYEALTAKEKELVTSNVAKLVKTYEEFGEADEVSKIIENIGEVEYKIACKFRIDDARKAYDELSEGAKAKVSAETLKVLTDAEACYANLEADASNTGCSGSIVAASGIVTLVTLLGAGLVLGKRKED